MSGPYQGRDLSNCGVGRLRVAINCGVLSVKANRASETEEQRKERPRIRREKDRARRRTKNYKRERKRRRKQKTTRESTWPLSKD